MNELVRCWDEHQESCALSLQAKNQHHPTLLEVTSIVASTIVFFDAATASFPLFTFTLCIR